MDAALRVPSVWDPGTRLLKAVRLGTVTREPKSRRVVVPPWGRYAAISTACRGVRARMLLGGPPPTVLVLYQARGKPQDNKRVRMARWRVSPSVMTASGMSRRTELEALVPECRVQSSDPNRQKYSQSYLAARLANRHTRESVRKV